MNSKPTAETAVPVIMAYVPVLHEGYRRFIENHSPPARKLYLLGPEFTHQYRPLVKDIRALEPTLIAETLRSWYPGLEVAVLDEQTLSELESATVIAPDEDISRQVLATHLPKTAVEFDSIFLRWDHQKSLAAEPLEQIPTIKADKFQAQYLQQAQDEALKSSDWWRHVGAVLVPADGKTVLSDHNHHLPSAHAPYVAGDPRANFHKGEHIELTTAIHAEAAVIGSAARQGVATAGATLYVTTFPCPVCAKLIAQAGIKKLYFSEGYAMLDGWEVVKDNNCAVFILNS